MKTASEIERPEFTKWWNGWYNPSDAMGDPREFAFAVWLNARSKGTPNASLPPFEPDAAKRLQQEVLPLGEAI